LFWRPAGNTDKRCFCLSARYTQRMNAGHARAVKFDAMFAIDTPERRNATPGAKDNGTAC